MGDELFSAVRKGAEFVVERARLVQVNSEELARFADSIRVAEARPLVDESYFFVGLPEDTAAYVLTFTAVNFGSGWHPHLRKLPDRSGSITMMTRLTERFHDQGPLAADELTAMTPELVAELFVQPLEPPVDELMRLFALALSELGQLLLTRFDGQFTALIEDADHSAAQLAKTLLSMSLFRDTAEYEGREVPLLKRAQIASADLSAALGAHPLGRFDDLDQLTIFADNLVPHVLRVEGVLEYTADLAAAIEAGEPLRPGSAEEVEIRASAIWAVEQMVDRLRRTDRDVTAAGLDYLLWSSGQAPNYKATPRHRCLTPFY